MKPDSHPASLNNQITLTTRAILNNLDVKSLYRVANISEQDCSPFLDYRWQQSWVKTLDSPIKLVEFWLQEALIGFAFLGEVKTAPVLPFKKVLLNQSGISNNDQVWIEFNDIICNQAHKSRCISILLEHLFKHYSTVRLEASFLHRKSPWLSAADKMGIGYEQASITSYEYIFDEKNIEDTFSSNTRSQIRRALKKARAEFGELSVQTAPPHELNSYLEHLGALHIAQWGDTPEGSGFQNPSFLHHHQSMMHQAPERVDILKVSAGEKIIGYGYYLIHNNKAYFYCAGINYDVAINAVKPGYLLHYLAMQHYAKKGLTAYDFLGGHYRYKKSLSNNEYTFTTVTFFNPNPVAKLLEACNRIVKQWQSAFKNLLRSDSE